MKALFYITKEGGTHFLILLEIMTEILFLEGQLELRIVPVYIYLAENLHVDFRLLAQGFFQTTIFSLPFSRGYVFSGVSRKSISFQNGQIVA